MSFNNILIKANIDISNGNGNTTIELTYGHEKFHYNQNNSNYLMMLNLEKFIDNSLYEFIFINDSPKTTDIVLLLFDEEYTLYYRSLITDIIRIKKENKIIKLINGDVKNINFNINLIFKKHLKKENFLSYDIHHIIGPYAFIWHLNSAIKIPYIIILHGKNLEIIKNISSINNIVYKLYKINNTIIIQLKKMVPYNTLFFHHKQIQKKTHKIDKILLSEFEEFKIIKNMLDIHIPTTNKFPDICKWLNDIPCIIMSRNVSGIVEKRFVVYYKIVY